MSVLRQHVWDSLELIAESVNEGRELAVSLVDKALVRIAEIDPTYNAVITTLETSARKRAQIIDAQIKSGKKAGRLAGVPFIAKDNFLVFGGETTAGSNMLKGFVAPYQSTAIERLEAEGAICVAKANMDAFGHGGSTENSDFFVTKNPHDVTRVAGGSSGGSAASIALDLVPFSLGTDTGGSIRQPASYCGVVGYKPSYGLVSRSGVVAMASSTDTIGAFAHSVQDVALVMDIMSGKDVLDGTTIDKPTERLDTLQKGLAGKKVAIVEEYFGDGVDAEVSAEVQRAVKKIEAAGALVEKISLPSLPLALAIYYIVVPAELSSNLARHDGIRYEFSARGTSSLEEHYEQSRSQGFGAEAKRRIMIGTHVLSSGYYDAYYKKAQTVRTKLINEFNAAFNSYDFLVGPVAPTTAFTIGQNKNDPVQMYLQDIMTVAASLVGIPAMSIPCAEVRGLPVGMQVMARQGNDNELLSFGASFQELKV